MSDIIISAVATNRFFNGVEDFDITDISDETITVYKYFNSSDYEGFTLDGAMEISVGDILVTDSGEKCKVLYLFLINTEPFFFISCFNAFHLPGILLKASRPNYDFSILQKSHKIPSKNN